MIHDDVMSELAESYFEIIYLIISSEIFNYVIRFNYIIRVSTF